MASGRRRQHKESDQVDADRLMAEQLRRKWEEEDGLVGIHLGSKDSKSSNFGEWDYSDLDEDFELARKIQSQGDIENNDVNMNGSVIDPTLELSDPNPDIWHLFRCFDARFFDRKLVNAGVELSWSPKMTMCAGLCGWNPRSKACFIRLSKPLLELRPRKDLVETLIHEMIHAILFVQMIDDNHESHGQAFHQEMYRINLEGQCKITVYHNFHDEVRHFKSHVWRCTGPCKDRPPYHGWLRRAMNRAPGPSDYWYSQHQATCGGTYVKVSEPEKIKKRPEGGERGEGKARSKKQESPKEKSLSQDLRNFFTQTATSPSVVSTSQNSIDDRKPSTHNLFTHVTVPPRPSAHHRPETSKSRTTIIEEIDLD